MTADQTPAEPQDLETILADLRAKRDHYHDEERKSAAIKDWQGADRWRHITSGLDLAIDPLSTHIGLVVLRAASRESAEAGLDEAWAEAEAALPEGWRGPVLRRSYDFPNQYWALADEDPGDHFREGYGPTPADALRALAARLSPPEEPPA